MGGGGGAGREGLDAFCLTAENLALLFQMKHYLGTIAIGPWTRQNVSDSHLRQCPA